MVVANERENMLPENSSDGSEDSGENESERDEVPEDPQADAETAAEDDAGTGDGGEAGAVENNAGAVSVAEGDAGVTFVIGYDESGRLLIQLGEQLYVPVFCITQEGEVNEDIMENEIINILSGHSNLPFVHPSGLDMALINRDEDDAYENFYNDHQVRHYFAISLSLV